MTEENRRRAIAQELLHMRQARAAALALRGLGLYNDALSRLYYALFHAATALLLTHGVEARRHRALPGLLGTHCSDVITAADIALVSRAGTYRDLADYERTWNATVDVADGAFAEVEPFLDRVLDQLRASGWVAREP